MKRIFSTLVLLTILYIILQLMFKYFGNGHEVSYELKSDVRSFQIKETFVTNRKDEKSNYYFEIKRGDTLFSFQSYHDFHKNDRVIKEIKYFKDNTYECILPVFEKKQLITDIMCIDGNQMNYYHNLAGKDEALDAFAQSLSEIGYETDKWIDQLDRVEKEKELTVFVDNIQKDHYIAVKSYKGIYNINNYRKKTIFPIEIFSTDYYDRTLEGLAGRYYVVVNYNEKYDYHEFELVDVVYNDRKNLVYHSKISYNSYIQGSVGNSIYILDRENKKQYEIDTKVMQVVEVGNEETGIKYYHAGKWDIIPCNEALKKDLKFQPYESDFYQDKGYVRVDKVGNVLSGNYYLYQKVGNRYEVYRTDVQNKEIRTFLFTTSEIDHIYYVDGFIYYQEGNYVKYYSDMTGLRTLLQNTEFEFNDTLTFYAYQ